MRSWIEHQAHVLQLRQRGVVGEQDAFVDERPQGGEYPSHDGATTNLEERFVDAAEARGAPASEDQGTSFYAARVRRVPH